MFKTLLALVLSVYATFFCEYARAEDLVLVGSVEPVGIKLYADRDSITRRADLSQVKAVVIPDPTKKTIETLQLVFDCDARAYYSSETPRASVDQPMNWEKSGERFSIATPAIHKMFAMSCKRFYEFWK